MEQENVRFSAGDAECAARFFRPGKVNEAVPCVVMERASPVCGTRASRSSPNVLLAPASQLLPSTTGTGVRAAVSRAR